ncbi:hypothetical protein CYY_004710 [Polysphondylium violaceum]|uniref:cellulase n=1 Tax=Polysphondylium violaceum TaxID=133409 RepID=A0A8J4UZ29_9MYCE|nr:hypothetical protein CYY_004710 [Polysphondylium violaceum]
MYIRKSKFILTLLVLVLSCSCNSFTIKHNTKNNDGGDTDGINQFMADTDFCDVLNKALMFYKYNRAGRLPDDDVPWRGNAALGDSSPGSSPDANGDGNLSGGYFDAGDHVKFGLPMSASMTMLGWGYLENKDAIEKCGATELYVQDLMYGWDWLMAAHTGPNEFAAQVGNGEADHAYWGPPEMMTMARPTYMINEQAPGTEVAMESAAALSICFMILNETNPDYANNCMDHAKQLYSFGDNYRAVYSDSVPDAQNFYKSWSGYDDEIVWATLWMHRATGDSSYLTRAQSDYDSLTIGKMAQANSHDWDLKAPGVCLLMTQAFPGTQQYVTDFEGFMNWWLPDGGVPYTPGGLAWIREWAPARYASNAAFLSSVYAKSGADTKYQTFTQSQISYILGNNPNSQSFVVGIGPNHPINPHHRASHHSLTDNIMSPVNNTYLLLGALVGGPSQDDSYKDDRTDYVRNEVACDYQACFVGNLAYLASLASGNN